MIWTVAILLIPSSAGLAAFPRFATGRDALAFTSGVRGRLGGNSYRGSRTCLASSIENGADAEITLYRDINLEGPSQTLSDSVSNFQNINFNDEVSSGNVSKGIWILYVNANYDQKFAVWGPGVHNVDPSYNDMLSSVQAIPENAIALFEKERFEGAMQVFKESGPVSEATFNGGEVGSLLVTGGTWKLYRDSNVSSRANPSFLVAESTGPNNDGRFEHQAQVGAEFLANPIRYIQLGLNPTTELEDAVDIVIDTMHPEYRQYREEIFDWYTYGTIPSGSGPPAAVVQFVTLETLTLEALPFLTECQSAVVNWVASLVSVYLGILGIPATSQQLGEPLEALFAQNPGLLEEFEAEAVNFNALEGASATEIASSLYEIGKKLFQAKAITQGLYAYFATEPWYIKAGQVLLALGTLTLWFASEGAALYAKLLLIAVNTGFLFDNSRKVVSECNTSALLEK